MLKNKLPNSKDNWYLGRLSSYLEKKTFHPFKTILDSGNRTYLLIQYATEQLDENFIIWSVDIYLISLSLER